MKKLNASQQRILQYLHERTEDGLPPSVREICSATGLKSTSTVHAHLKTLEREGYISRQAGLNRAIFMNESHPEERFAQIPILGRVTAGIPITAIQDVEGYVPFSESERRGRELFALRVMGDSMQNAGILDGDIVISHRIPTAENGDIVVAMIEDEATVKRFYQEREGFRLQPENEDYEPIYCRELSILGKVISVVRYYN